MTKEVTTKENNAPVVYDPTVLGAAGEITAQDLTIDRIGCLNALSKMVKERLAQAGDIVNATTKEVLVPFNEEPLEFIIVKTQRYWIRMNNGEYESRTPAIHQNEKPWTEQGGVIKNIYCHSYFILLKEEVLDGFALPYELTFRSTDLKEARKLNKWLFMMAGKEKASWDKYFTLGATEKKNVKHEWFGYNIGTGSETGKPERQMAYEMFVQISEAAKKGNVVTDDNFADDNSDF